MTKEEVRAAVETELFSLKLKEPLTPTQIKIFCEYIERNFPYQSNDDRTRELIAWTETWQSFWLPDKLMPGEDVDVVVARTVVGEPRFRLPWPGWALVGSRIVVAWRAAAGLVFTKQRAAVPQNEFDEARDRLDEVTGENFWRPRGSNAPVNTSISPSG
jgi:hypothetical protein